MYIFELVVSFPWFSFICICIYLVMYVCMNKVPTVGLQISSGVFPILSTHFHLLAM
jgi:hypothetical protein